MGGSGGCLPPRSLSPHVHSPAWPLHSCCVARLARGKAWSYALSTVVVPGSCTYTVRIMTVGMGTEVPGGVDLTRTSAGQGCWGGRHRRRRGMRCTLLTNGTVGLMSETGTWFRFFRGVITMCEK